MDESLIHHTMRVSEYLDGEGRQTDQSAKTGLTERIRPAGYPSPRLEIYRRNAAERFELLVFEGAACQAELASIGWHGQVARLLD